MRRDTMVLENIQGRIEQYENDIKNMDLQIRKYRAVIALLKKTGGYDDTIAATENKIQFLQADRKQHVHMVEQVKARLVRMVGK